MVDYDKMLGKIKDYFFLCTDEYFEITDNDSIVKIYNLINNGLINNGVPPPPIDENDDSVMMLYYGLYFYCVFKYNEDVDEDESINNMKKYYLMAIDKGNTDAMTMLANFFVEDQKWNDKDLRDDIYKYYEMAIDRGNTKAMIKLAQYYIHYGTDIKYKSEHILRKRRYNYDDKVVKYFLMGIEKGDTQAMVKLGDYYMNCKLFDNAKKYYLIAIENNNERGFGGLCNYYKEKRETENDIITLSIKYNMYHIFNFDQLACSRAAKYKFTKEDLDILSNRTFDELKDAPEFIKMIHRMIKTPIDIMKLHFDYTVHGKGYDEAKNDFFKNITGESQ